MTEGSRPVASRIIAYAAAVLLGIAIGGASALAMGGLIPGLRAFNASGVDVDGWRSDFAIGSSSADPYTRARVARSGLLALARSEAVYFTTDTDVRGRMLSEHCDYRIIGGDMPAHWWSITLYDGASRLPMNDDGALSIDASRVGDGSWSAVISPQRPDNGMWISSRAAGNFDVTLRLYVPDGHLFTEPHAALNPPRIERLNCPRGAA